MIDNSNEVVGLVKENEKQLIKFAWLNLIATNSYAT